MEKPLSQWTLELEELCNEAGWDQPTRIFCFAKNQDEFIPTVTTAFEGHPVEELPAINLPEGTEAIVLVCEGWSYPTYVMDEITKRAGGDDDLFTRLQQALWQASPPASRPDRVENRLVVALSLDGQTASVFRVRNQEPITDGDLTSGRVWDALVELLERSRKRADHV